MSSSDKEEAPRVGVANGSSQVGGRSHFPGNTDEEDAVYSIPMKSTAVTGVLRISGKKRAKGTKTLEVQRRCRLF